MRILLISAGTNRGFRPAVPFGTAILAAELEHEGHDVFCLDLYFEENPAQSLQAVANTATPDVIGISIRNLDNQSILEPVFHLPRVKRLAQQCRQILPECPLVLGGAAFSLVPDETMRFVEADYGVIGPGEKTFPRLLERLAKKQPLDGIPGIAQRHPGGHVSHEWPDQTVNFFGAAPFPADHIYDARYFDCAYQTPTPIKEITEPVLSTRGCPNHCLYCSTATDAGHLFLLKHPNKTVDEVERITRQGRARRFEFADAAFNLPHDHALAILREMRRRKSRAPWNCMLNPKGVSRELVRLMAETGCDYVEMGTDSGSIAALEQWKKGFSVTEITEAHRLVDDQGIGIEHCVFLGGPGEDRDSTLRTLELLDQLVPNARDSRHKAYINLGFRVFPRTPLHAAAVREGLLRETDLMAPPRFYLAPSVAQNGPLLDEIEATVVAHKNWYLWWGLPEQSLRDRLQYAALEFEEMANLYANS